MKNIIFLNGVTSTGKTSTAKELQKQSDRELIRISNDLFQSMVSENLLRENYFRSLSRAIELMYRSAKLYCERGYAVIIDGMLLELDEFKELFGLSHHALLREILPENELFIATLTCPPDECRRRNIERGDRGAEQSDWQRERMSHEIVSDIVIDSAAYSPGECARMILQRI